MRAFAIKQVLAGESRRSVVCLIGVKRSRHHSDTGSPAPPGRMDGDCKPKLEEHRAWMLDRIEACLTITLAHLLFLPPAARI